MNRKASLGIGTFAVVAALVMAPALSAAAIDDRYGFRECPVNRVVRVTSTTSTTGSPTGTFAVAHTVNSVGPSWSSAGFHAYTSPYNSGNWYISTTGTISSHGTTCAVG